MSRGKIQTLGGDKAGVVCVDSRIAAIRDQEFLI